ncbi:MAG: ATP-dependent DNA helicase RecG [Fimbriimonas ginsengisoli]|uniref:ATP-dependent DNA helicase RecG n=1 Tax=Fimbriimonas ginsengisoli TaxID=1005039 RepID=A0A931LVZ5_FIMGI|nr:ATP-dependent DNA helicase RecG [Fimbriimonas ginsengisoli]
MPTAYRTLDSETQFLKGVGPRFAAAMAKAGLRTVRDVLYHLPRRYEDRRHIPPIASVRPGQFVTVKGELTAIEGRPMRRGMVIVRGTLSDATGNIDLVWFNQPWHRRQLEKARGQTVIAYGMAKEARWGCEIASPEYEILGDGDDAEAFARIVPVYPLTDGLPQVTVRKAARDAIARYLDAVQDPLPSWILREQMLRDLRWCLRQIHQPESDDLRLEARRRLVFEEFLVLQVALAMRRAETHAEIGTCFPISRLLAAPAPVKAKQKAPPPSALFTEIEAELREAEPLWDQIHRMLPFELTGAQRRVIEEIWADMESPHPMNRLLQGDVGSGKTAVAACAMLAAVRCGYQSALMAPTEILAEQHHANLREIFEPLGIEIALLVGKQTPTQKKKAAARTASGAAHLAVGTHALIQEGVSFAKLGLVVIDEQHRFGVLQRAALREKGLGNPDVLVMTATPIPRTLTMTLYGDLDLSVIDEMPPGRMPVRTHAKTPGERESVYKGVRKLIESGRQAYFVCPMVSESEKMLAQAAEELAYRLRQEVYPDLRIGLLHGQLPSKQKEEAMDAFRRHELDILVSTTVIEVGVDVANASVMVVEDANRFGLSQLHQLRGRVGRGAHQSFCILIGDARTDDAQARLDIMVQTQDGFKIAEEDLRLRGPGELAGTRQSGNVEFKIADLVQDGKMLEVARQVAIELIRRDPHLAAREHQALRQRVTEERPSLMAVVSVS